MSARRPRATLIVAALLTASAFLATLRLSVDSSGEALLVRDSDAYRFLAATEAVFGGDEVVLIVLRSADALAPDALRRLAAVTEAVSGVPGVARALSLTSLHWPRAVGDDVRVDPVFEDGKSVPQDVLAHPLVTPTLLSADRRSTVVLAFTNVVGEQAGSKRKLVERIDSAVAAAAPGAEVFAGGAPHAQVELDSLVGRLTARLGLVSLALMGLVLFAIYRSAHAVWLPLVAVVVALVWTFGAASLMDRTLGIVTSVIPPLVVAIGASYAIRVLSEVNRVQETDPDHPAPVVVALDEVGPTVLVCGLTTLLGFAPLITSPVEALATLGLFAVIGTAFTTVTTVTVIPAVLQLLPRTTRQRRASGLEDRLTVLMRRLALFTQRRGGAILAGSAVLLAAGMCGLPWLYVDQDFYDWFPADSAVARSTGVINRELGGANPLMVVLRSPAGAYDPAMYRGAAALSRHLRAQPEILSVASASDYLALLHGALGGRDDLPATPQLVAQELLLLDGAAREQLAALADEASGQLRILFRHDVASGFDVERLVARLETALPTLVPAPVTARLAGIGLVRLEANRELTRGLFEQLLLASVLIGALIAGVLGSVRLGAMTILVNVLPLLFLYGVLGLLGVPLNVATVTTAAAALGNTVDDTVQFLDRYRRRRTPGMSAGDGCRIALEEVGLPMIASDVLLIAGFSVLVLSDFFPVSAFGLLGSLGMALSLLANLFVVPPLLERWEARA